MIGEGPSKTGSDADFVARALDGDKASFGALVDRYWSMAVAVALSKTGDAARAEDLAQEGFVQAYLSLPALRDPSRFAGWLGRIVAKKSMNHVRRHRSRTPLAIAQVPEPESPALAAVTANPGMTPENRRRVVDAIRRLPDNFQTVVIMRFVTGLSTAEIAHQLGKRPGTVRVWVHRACERLRKDLALIREEVHES